MVYGAPATVRGCIALLFSALWWKASNAFRRAPVSTSDTWGRR